MVVYNLKSITAVPTAKDFIDIVLSKTQRKTPTVIHKNYQISRIRSFYMRKVKFTAQSYHDKLNQILTDFPVLDEIHPFYADLMNVLYDRDHYKLALGQLNTAKALIDRLGKDYLRLLKYGDSLYRCKQLKRAAMGRMCTLMKKQGPNLAYLEQVRQHLARLPSIDPNARTILICGYPNVGKSSYMNKVTRANVEVQPYAFTTKSLFVGHTDHRYLRWQVIDTPGILDHPLEERNTIEMQSITALAHLKAAILFIMDISEECGYSLKQQIELFKSIKPLFVNKPLIIALNKIDVMPFESLEQTSKSLLDELAKDENVNFITMSTLTEEGVSKVKEYACDKLLAQRVELKMNNKTISTTMNRLHVALPVPRDQKERLPFVPESVLKARADQAAKMKEEEKTESTFTLYDNKAPDLQEDWDPTIFGPDFRKEYILANDEWKFDAIPEFIDGKNIADYLDPEIMERLDELEREEEERERLLESEEMGQEPEEGLTEAEREMYAQVTEKKALMVQHHRSVKNTNETPLPRKRKRDDKSLDEFAGHLKELGIDATNAVERARSKSRGRSQSRGRSLSASASKKQRLESKSRERSRSMTPAPGEGYKDIKQKTKANSLAKKSAKDRNKSARKGEADRVILNMKPKHLFSGKRTIGKTDRR